MNKLIKQVKSIIDLRHNQFNLNNYVRILAENGIITESVDIDPERPISLMADGNMKAQILTLGKKEKKNIYIVGKGILFDSGGLNLKTGRGGMIGMHGDKAGMITALCVANYLKKNVVAYCPVTTNFIHISKIAPCDIIKIGKKEVEVMDTDAEGRLILADALEQLNATKDDIVITIATLTGACAYAVDTKATAYLTPNDALAEKYAEANKEAKEYAWRLPLWDYMEKAYKTNSIKSIDKKVKADTIGAAVFLKQFVKYPNNWIHLDIATSAFTEDGKATGVPTQSLINFINKL